MLSSPQKTNIQTGPVGAILLAGALMVRVHSIQLLATGLIYAYKVYHTFILWNLCAIIRPCLTFITTFSELENLTSK